MQNIFDRMLNNKVVKLIIKVLHDRFRAACVDTSPLINSSIVAGTGPVIAIVIVAVIIIIVIVVAVIARSQGMLCFAGEFATPLCMPLRLSLGLLLHFVLLGF